MNVTADSERPSKPAARARHCERGGVLVEFALASTFMFTLILGIYDFGRAAFDYHLVANGARLGTRYAIVHGANSCTPTCTATKAQLTAAIASYVQGVSPGLDVTQLSVTANWTNTTPSCVTPYGQGCLVAVTVSYPFASTMSFGNVTMSSTSQMAISQ